MFFFFLTRIRPSFLVNISDFVIQNCRATCADLEEKLREVYLTIHHCTLIVISFLR